MRMLTHNANGHSHPLRLAKQSSVGNDLIIMKICQKIGKGPSFNYLSMAGVGRGHQMLTDAQIWKGDVQQGTNIPERLLNEPYVNEVTLRGQKQPLKCC